MPKKSGKGPELKDVLRALDRKDHDFYSDNISLFPLVRFMSSCKSKIPELSEYYLLATNRVNKYFWDIGKHKKLQWLLLCSISPFGEINYHPWIKTKHEDNKIINFLKKVYPTEKVDDLVVLSKVLSEAEIKQMMREFDV